MAELAHISKLLERAAGEYAREMHFRRSGVIKIGVGRESSRIATIHPQPHDIPMDFVVTEAGVHEVTRAGLRLLAP